MQVLYSPGAETKSQDGINFLEEVPHLIGYVVLEEALQLPPLVL